MAAWIPITNNKILLIMDLINNLLFTALNTTKDGPAQFPPVHNPFFSLPAVLGTTPPPDPVLRTTFYSYNMPLL